MPVAWLEHEGKRILHGDYRGLVGDELIRVLEEGAEAVLSSPEPILVLSDFQGVDLTREYVTRAKELNRACMPKMTRHAVLLDSNLQRVLHRAFVAETQDTASEAFMDRAKALDWLAQ